MTTKTVRTLLVIDDHPLFRKGAADLIAMDPSLRMIGEASSGEEGLERALALKPDLILLDLQMKGMDGLRVLQAIKAAGTDSRVIMLTVSDSEEDVVAALRAGADGYLLKDMEPEDILQQLLAASRGQLVMSNNVTKLVARALRVGPQPKTVDEAGLTEREREIVKLIANGFSNKRIARSLGITEGTVKVHVKHLLKKLNLHSRVEVAVWAVKKV